MTRIAASPRTPSRRGGSISTRRTAATGVQAELQRALATLSAGSARSATPTVAGPVMGVGQVPNPSYLAYQNATGGLRGTGGMSGWGTDSSWKGNPYNPTTQGAVSLGYPSTPSAGSAGGGTGNPFFDAATRAEEEARRANEERYTNLLTAGQERQQGVMDLIGQQGQSQTTEINRLFDNRLGAVQQDLVSRGLAADPSLVLATDRERQRALLELQDRLLGQRIGAQERLSGDVLRTMENRTDQYPDVGPLMQMAQQYNQAGQSSQPLPGASAGGVPIVGNPLGFSLPGGGGRFPMPAGGGGGVMPQPAGGQVRMPAATPFRRTTAIAPGTTPWWQNVLGGDPWAGVDPNQPNSGQPSVGAMPGTELPAGASWNPVGMSPEEILRRMSLLRF